MSASEDQLWGQALEEAERLGGLQIIELLVCGRCGHACLAVHPLFNSGVKAQCSQCGEAALVGEVEWR